MFSSLDITVQLENYITMNYTPLSWHTRCKSGTTTDQPCLLSICAAAECCGQCACIPGCKAWTWSKITKICYPKSADGWYSESRNNIISGIVTSSSTPQEPIPVTETLIWAPVPVIGEHSLRNFGKTVSNNPRADYKYVVKDPTCSSNDTVVRAMYLQGRWSPGGGDGGGVLFFAWPEGKHVNLGNTVRLEYQVYFPENFPWVKGGKLPGIIGGKTGCGGGDSATDCFSGANVTVCWCIHGWYSLSTTFHPVNISTILFIYGIHIWKIY